MCVCVDNMIACWWVRNVACACSIFMFIDFLRRCWHSFSLEHLFLQCFNQWLLKSWLPGREVVACFRRLRLVKAHTHTHSENEHFKNICFITWWKCTFNCHHLSPLDILVNVMQPKKITPRLEWLGIYIQLINTWMYLKRVSKVIVITNKGIVSLSPE